MSWRIRHPSTLVERWFHAGPNADGALGRYDGAAANLTGWPTTAPKNSLSCPEFNGNNSVVVLGDVIQLNAVSAFTICFWMNQDILNVVDTIFDKGGFGIAESGLLIVTSGGGDMYIQVDGSNQRGFFDYSAEVNAGQWHHVAVVFNGAGAGNTGRLQAYVDASPITLTYNGTIPAVTDDLSGSDATIGRAAAAFDGRLWDFRIYQRSLSRDEISRVIHQPAPLV